MTRIVKYALSNIRLADNSDVLNRDNVDSKITSRFQKLANELRSEQAKGRQISPKVDDFLYGTAVIMHAAEANLIDQDTGLPVLNKSGKPARGWFENTIDKKGRPTVKWVSPDQIELYANQNRDIFPEEDLIVAHKKWIGKPLCKDHISSTVDGIRGIILDTVYDPKFKRVHALFALDRKNYGELARKVEAGYATSVSMGTAVGRSICTECHNVATVEAEYCDHVRLKTCKGEVNKDLSPIELSLVVTGADPRAKIKQVLAHLQNYKGHIEKVAAGLEDPSSLDALQGNIDAINQDLSEAPSDKEEDSSDEDQVIDELVDALGLLKNRNVSGQTRKLGEDLIRHKLSEIGKTLDQLSPNNRKKLLQAANSARIDLGEEAIEQTLKGLLGKEPEENLGMQPGMISSEGPQRVNEKVDSAGYGLLPPENGAGISQQVPSAVFSSKEKNTLAEKIASLKTQISELEKRFNKMEKIDMSLSELTEQLNKRKAYWQGTEEPTPGKPQYPLMGDQDDIREKEDRQMTQTGDLGGEDGMVPSDEKLKPMIQRAGLEQRMAARAQTLAKIKSGKVEIIETKEGKKKAIDTSTGTMMAKDKKDEDEKDSKDKKDSKKKEKESKDSKKESKDSKDDKASKKTKKAYWQGTEDPTPGKAQYPLMGDQDGLREKEDRQMLQTGPLGGDDGMVPGDEKIKKPIQRAASVVAKFHKAASPGKSRWTFDVGSKRISFTAEQVYQGMLDKKHANSNKTYAELFNSIDYGRAVRAQIKNAGIHKTADRLGVKVAEDPAGLPLPPPPAPDSSKASSEAPKSSGDEGSSAAGGDDVDQLKKDLDPLINKVEDALDSIKKELSEGTGATEGLDDMSVGTPPTDTVAPPDAGAEVGSLPPPPAPKAASVRDLFKVYAFLTDLQGELCFIQSSASKNASASFMKTAYQSMHDAKIALNDAHAQLKSFAAAQKEGWLAKRAARRQALVAKAMDEINDCGDNMMHNYDMDAKDKKDSKSKDSKESKDDKKKDSKDSKDDKKKESKETKKDKEDDAMDMTHMAPGTEFVLDDEEKKQAGDIAEHQLEKHEHDPHAHLEEFKAAEHEMPAYDTNPEMKLARKKWREELISNAKAGKWMDIYEDERKKGGTKLDFDQKVPDDGDKVETLHEIHEKMEEVATKPLSKVREAAEKLDKWIKSGGINADKLDKLVAEGAVDSDAAKYWKDFYGQAEKGKEFAAGMVQEFGSKKTASGTADREVRIRRAYSLGLEAQRKGIIGRTNVELDRYVDTLVNVPDEMFNGLKAHVEMLKVPSHLTAAPLVGLNNTEHVKVATASSENFDPTFENLAMLFDKRK